MPDTPEKSCRFLGSVFAITRYASRRGDKYYQKECANQFSGVHLLLPGRYAILTANCSLRIFGKPSDLVPQTGKFMLQGSQGVSSEKGAIIERNSSGFFGCAVFICGADT